MLGVVVDRSMRGGDGRDALSLALGDDTGDVGGDVLAEGEDVAVSYWGVGAKEFWKGQVSRLLERRRRILRGAY